MSDVPAFFEPLYDGYDRRDAQIFAPIVQFFRPPAKFSHGDWHLVAEIPKEPPDGDGHAVRIYESRLPARFFKVEVIDGKNSMGRPKKGFALSTGSGNAMGALCVQIAIAASRGMIELSEGAEE